MKAKNIITKRQFADLIALSRKLLKTRLDKIAYSNTELNMALIDQAHQMYNGAIEVIANAYTDISEEQ